MKMGMFQVCLTYVPVHLSYDLTDFDLCFGSLDRNCALFDCIRPMF